MPRRSRAQEEAAADWRYELLVEVSNLSFAVQSAVNYWRRLGRNDMVAQVERLNALVALLREGANEAIRGGGTQKLAEAVALLQGPYSRYMAAPNEVRDELWRIRNILTSHLRQVKVAA